MPDDEGRQTLREFIQDEFPCDRETEDKLFWAFAKWGERRADREREECARVADNHVDVSDVAKVISKSIRARDKPERLYA